MLFWQSTDVVDILNNFEEKNMMQCFFCFRVINFMRKYFKSHYIFGGNTDRGVRPPRQYETNISLSIESSLIISLPSRQDASK